MTDPEFGPGHPEWCPVGDPDEVCEACSGDHCAECDGATRTAEQSHLVALAERDALTAERDTLAAWKAEALPLLDQWTKVWVALDKPGQLGDSLAASSLAEVHALTAQVEALTAQRDEAVRLLRQAMAEVSHELHTEPTGDAIDAFLRGVDQ